MVFNPHTDADRTAMLEAIGVDFVADLFEPVSPRIRFPVLDLPPALTEMDATERLGDLAERNLAPKAGRSFLGAGAYHHFIPATVDQILRRGEFYTAYTPYQPEVAQGTMQVIYEFQSMVASLLGLEVANASIYDGATALAEGVLVAMSSAKQRRKVVVSGTIHPAYRGVLETYLSGESIDFIDLPIPTGGFVEGLREFEPYLNDDLAVAVIQYPNFFGGIEDVRAIADAVHGAGGRLVVSTSPVPLGMLTPPGHLGADVVTAEGQSLGVAPSFGGPYVGLLAAKKEYVRQMPGRLAGMTLDSEGKRGFVLTLQTREQHIRREKATSNICTNQGLMATAATVYMSSLGPTGFREVANRSYQNAHYLASRLAELPGYEVALDGPFFHEFVVRTPEPVAAINQRLVERGIIGGYDLAEVHPALERHMLICATELNGRRSIDALIAALAG
jgi:glycine dehydrogenase subunit 1